MSGNAAKNVDLLAASDVDFDFEKQYPHLEGILSGRLKRPVASVQTGPDSDDEEEDGAFLGARDRPTGRSPSSSAGAYKAAGGMDDYNWSPGGGFGSTAHSVELDARKQPAFLAAGRSSSTFSATNPAHFPRSDDAHARELQEQLDAALSPEDAEGEAYADYEDASGGFLPEEGPGAQIAEAEAEHGDSADSYANEWNWRVVTKAHDDSLRPPPVKGRRDAAERTSDEDEEAEDDRKVCRNVTSFKQAQNQFKGMSNVFSLARSLAGEQQKALDDAVGKHGALHTVMKRAPEDFTYERMLQIEREVADARVARDKNSVGMSNVLGRSAIASVCVRRFLFHVHACNRSAGKPPFCICMPAVGMVLDGRKSLWNLVFFSLTEHLFAIDFKDMNFICAIDGDVQATVRTNKTVAEKDRFTSKA